MIPITWKTTLTDVSKIKPTPNNFKIKNALGSERFLTSLKNFGLAGAVVCNTDYTLIDGNSRVEQARVKGLKKIDVSFPSRKLTTKEFDEMSALFDFAVAGDVDIERIEKELFKTKDIYAKWGMPVPMNLLDSMGANAKIKAKDAPIKPLDIEEPNDQRMVQLFFNIKQEAEFRKMEEVLMKKLKTNSTTETVLKVFKSFSNGVRRK